MNGLGDVLAVARKARGLTQIELAELVGLTQPAINRYESGDRDPDQHIVAKLAEILGVTDDLLIHGNRFRGALAVDAHMRRHKTTKASAWRQLEARLNLLRVHASFLFEEVAINSEQHVPAFDPEFTAAEDAARLVRAQWRMPMGPVVNLTRWMEAAGCLVFEEDFATQRIDGLSQWVDDYPVMLINANAAPDRKRLTLAHELGHLVLHSTNPTENMETEATAFAAEFLMPESEIRPELRRLDLGKLLELKREWGVSMQALLERAYRMGGRGSHQALQGDERARLENQRARHRVHRARKTEPTRPHRHDTPKPRIHRPASRRHRRIRQSCGQSIPPRRWPPPCDLTSD